MKALRTVAALLLVALTGWILVEVFAPPPPPAAPQRFTTSTQCRDCHAEVYGEWEGSWHAQSWTDPDVLALSENFSNTDCIDCHAPRPVFETGVANRVLPRASRRNEGVDCIACHLMPDGAVAGTIDKPSAPCTPKSVWELSKADFCAGCHDQHKTVQQWKDSSWFQKGVDCLDCHMPFRGGDPGRGRDHTMHGGHDLELVRSAVALRGTRTEGGWTIEVENVGAGHSFPTDERSRAADVFWRPLPAAGAAPGAWRHLYRFRSPYRYEVDVPDTLLLADETRALPLAEADADGAVEVALFYKLTPYWTDPAAPDPDREAQLVHRVELRP
ncbi:MAG: NapC/NirT family cytochrome c [Planctomycetes bacterium]|nr:NapC/NirT family cytochrome c [Planctomycetota bacterium]